MLILACLAFAGCLFVSLRRGISTAHLAVISLIPSLIGLSSIQTGLAPSIEAEILLTLMTAFLLPFAIQPRAPGAPRLDVVDRPQSVTRGSSKATAQFWTPGAPIILLTCYHLIVGGVPLLAANPEVARFNFTSSGLFGIPGRAFLFGVPLLVPLAFGIARASGVSPLRHNAVRISVLLFLFTGILSGFKSGIVDVLTTLLIVAAAQPERLSVSRAAWRALIFAPLALAVALGVGSTYATYASNGGVIASLQRRLTTGSAEAPAVLLSRPKDLNPTSDGMIQLDVKYFAAKYFDIGTQPVHSFNELVAARVLNVNGLTTTPLPSVTTGAFAELWYLWPVGAPLFAFGVGYFLKRVEWSARRYSADPGRFLVRAGILLALFSYITKGNLIYTLINWAVVLCAVRAAAAVGAKQSSAEKAVVR